jgi:uncharacterized protein YjiS (DUF1127 family)
MKPMARITDADETLKGKTMFASLHTSTMAVARVQSRGTFADLLAKLRFALIARTQRQQLLSLDAARLADIGVTRAQANAEANRSLWDVPKAWRR